MDSLGSLVGDKIVNFSDEGYEAFLKGNRALRKALSKDRKYEGAIRKGNIKEARTRSQSADSYEALGNKHLESLKDVDDEEKAYNPSTNTIDVNAPFKNAWDKYGKYTKGLAKSNKILSKESGSPRSSKTANYSTYMSFRNGEKAGISDHKIAEGLTRIFLKTNTRPEFSDRSLGETIAFNICNFSDGDFGVKKSLAKIATIGSIGLTALGGGIATNSYLGTPEGAKKAIEYVDNSKLHNFLSRGNLLVKNMGDLVKKKAEGTLSKTPKVSKEKLVAEKPDDFSFKEKLIKGVSTAAIPILTTAGATGAVIGLGKLPTDIAEKPPLTYEQELEGSRSSLEKSSNTLDKYNSSKFAQFFDKEFLHGIVGNVLKNNVEKAEERHNDIVAKAPVEKTAQDDTKKVRKNTDISDKASKLSEFGKQVKSTVRKSSSQNDNNSKMYSSVKLPGGTNRGV